MTRPVVAAAIVDSLSAPTKLLACSRAYPQELRGQFELPGGKVEDGEDPTVALAREIAEELVVGASTVKTHVSALLDKFGVTNRVQLAVAVAECTVDDVPR